MSYVRSRGVARSGLAGYARTGYVRTGLGTSEAVLQDTANKISHASLRDAIALALTIPANERDQLYFRLEKTTSVSPTILAAVKKAAPYSAQTFSAASVPVIGRGGTVSAPTQTVQVGLTAAQRAAMTPEQQAAYDAHMAAEALRVQQVQANAVRIVDHTGGQTIYVRDNTPEGIKAQQEGRLVTVENGGSGVLLATAPPPAEAPVTPGPGVAAGSGLFSGYMPWVLGGAGLLALLLLTRKKSSSGTPSSTP